MTPIHLDPTDKMVIELLLKNDQFKEKLAESDRAMLETGKSVEKTASNIEKMMALQSVVQGFEGMGRAIAGLGIGLKELAEDYARNLAVQDAFNQNMKEQGKNAKDVIEELEKITKGGLARSQIREFVNMGMAMDIPIDAFGDLMAISKKAAREMGMDVTQVTEAIVRGLGKESPEILENMGIKLRSMQKILHDYVIEMGLANAEDVKGIREAVAALSDKQRMLAQVREIQKKYARDITDEKNRTKDLNDVMNNLNATLKNLADSGLYKVGKGLAIGTNSAVEFAGSLGMTAVGAKALGLHVEKLIPLLAAKGAGAAASLAGAFTLAGAAGVAAIGLIAAELVVLGVLIGNIIADLHKLSQVARETARIKAETAAVVQQQVDETGTGRVMTTTEYKRSFWSGKRGRTTTTTTRYSPGGQPVQVNVNQMGGATIRNQQQRDMRSAG